MLKLIQPREGSFLLLSWRVQSKFTAMDREVVRNKREEYQLLGVSKRQVPISQIVVVHAAFRTSVFLIDTNLLIHSTIFELARRWDCGAPVNPKTKNWDFQFPNYSVSQFPNLLNKVPPNREASWKDD